MVTFKETENFVLSSRLNLKNNQTISIFAILFILLLKYCKPTFICDNFILLHVLTGETYRLQDVHCLKNNIPEKFENWLVVRNVSNDEAIVNLMKIS